MQDLKTDARNYVFLNKKWNQTNIWTLTYCQYRVIQTTLHPKRVFLYWSNVGYKKNCSPTLGSRNAMKKYVVVEIKFHSHLTSVSDRSK
jgi:hypothetical protein